MKALLINGSPRKNGNTDMMLDALREKLEEGGIDVERVQLGGVAVRGCAACMMCSTNLDRRCAVDDDIINVIIEKMLDSDAIVIGSPTYFGNVTTEVKALIDRAGLVGMVNDRMFRRKIGAALVAVRRAGGVEAFHLINNLFHLVEKPGVNPCHLINHSDRHTMFQGIFNIEKPLGVGCG